MKHCRWLALLLALALLLTGCDLKYYVQDVLPEQNGGVFSEIFSGIAPDEQEKTLVPFSEMPYTRPDEDALHALFNKAADLADEGKDADALMEALDAAFEAYDEFYTLDAIAMIRADADQTDAYYRDEYAWCEQLSSQSEQWLETMLKACAGSKLRKKLERAGYFAPHELDYYEDSDDYNDEMVKLYQQESELISAYRELTADPQVTLNGETVSLNEYLSGDISDEEYDEAYNTYLRDINEEAADLYCKLVRLRKTIAGACGYDSYEQMQYDYFGRDYGPDEVEDYLTSIREQMAPYRKALIEQGEYDKLTYPTVSERRIMSDLEKAMDKLGDPAASDFRMMREYELCDISVSLRKAQTSYTVYLPSYGVPYIFSSTYGDIEDELYVAHEFGHFVDAYYSDNANASLDLGECFSQGMEYLTLCNLRDILSEREYEALARIKLLDTLDTYAGQASYAAFEHAVYELPDEELNAETLNALSLKCYQDYGCDEMSEEACRLFWTQVSHFYELPFYVLSYCTSADAAMQLYQKELEIPGAGWDAYKSLLDDTGFPFLMALERAKLESPLCEGRAEQALAILKAQMPE